MTLVSGLQDGLIDGLKDGLNPALVAFPLDTLTPADIATITGLAEPDFMWMGRDPVGAVELVAGTADLVDISAPTHSVDSAVLGGTVCTFGSLVNIMETPLATDADIVAEAFAVCWIGSGTFGAARQIASKFATVGWRLGTAPGTIEFTVVSASGAITNSVSGQNGALAHVVIGVRRAAANEQALYTRGGSATSSRFNQTLVNTDKLAIGQNVGDRFGTAPIDFAGLIVWKGAAAESIDDSHRVLIAEALGYE